MIKRRLQWMWFLPLVAVAPLWIKPLSLPATKPWRNRTQGPIRSIRTPMIHLRSRRSALDEFIEVAASATCEAIFRCCDEQAVMISSPIGGAAGPGSWTSSRPWRH